MIVMITNKPGSGPKNVYAQSFNSDDVLYWIQNAPGSQIMIPWKKQVLLL